MRVLMLSWEYPPRVVGGLARHVYHLAKNLGQSGVEVHVLTAGQDGVPPRERRGRVMVHRVASYPLVAPDFLTWVLQLNLALLEQGVALMEDYGFDLIHAHDWLVALTARALKHLYRTPLVATLHATEHGRHQGLHNASQRYISGVEWYLTYEAWKVICCSQYMKSDLVSVFNLPAEKVVVIANGVDPGLGDGGDHHPRQPVVLFVGRLVPEKGVGVLLDAAPRVLEVHPQARLVITGTGPAAADLRAHAAALGLGERVIFTGYVDDGELARLYRSAAMAVFPSLYEPFGIVALEAMAAGTPVIVADSGGLGEIVEHEVTGLKVEPGNPRALAAAVIRLLDDPRRGRELARAARHQALSRYSWPAIAAATAALYVATTSEHRRSGWRRDLSGQVIRRARALGRQVLGVQP